VEICPVPYPFLLLGQSDALLRDDRVEVIESGDMFVNDRFVDERPKRLGWLQFGTVGRKEDKTSSRSRRRATAGMSGSRAPRTVLIL